MHGDLASVEAGLDGARWLLHGRSDDTIKVSGRRVGPAEIEAAVLHDDRIAEAAAIGVPDRRSGERITVFVVLRAGAVADPGDLTRSAVAAVGNSFAPTVHVVASLPKTTNGKIMRRAIRARHLGSPAGDLSALDASCSLEDIPVLVPGAGSADDDGRGRAVPCGPPGVSERALAADVSGHEVEERMDRPGRGMHAREGDRERP